METILNDGVIDGRLAARRVRAGVKADIARLRAEHNLHPQIAFVRVGNDPASKVYVASKARACTWVKMRSQHIHLPENVSEDELLAVVQRLNKDDDIDGILVQLPLPDHLSRQVLNTVEPLKDVDGFHPMNLGSLLAGRGPLHPCTPAGIMRMIAMMKLDLSGMRSVVVGRSVIVGRPMNSMLLRASATATCCHRYTEDLESHVRRADILVVATGVPGLIKGAWINPGAYVFDVGITRLDNGTLVGDVEFESAHKRAAGITPVPGGVGPMTIAMLLENTVKAAQIRRGLLPWTILRA